MQYLVLSFSHRNASLSLREKLSIGENEVDLLLEYILHSNIVKVSFPLVLLPEHIIYPLIPAIFI